MEFSCDVPGLDLFWNPVMQDLAHTSGFLTEPNPVPDQWPKPEPIAEEDQIVVPGEGKDNFPETEAAAQMDLHNFRRIPVVGKDKRLVGIVSLSDIHQAIFKRELAVA